MTGRPPKSIFVTVDPRDFAKYPSVKIASDRLGIPTPAIYSALSTHTPIKGLSFRWAGPAPSRRRGMK